jgi:hypothetical protein
MRRRVAIFAAVLAVLAGGSWLALWAFSTSRHAPAAPEALAALASDAAVRVEAGSDLVFQPADGAVRLGVILYPGASSDPRGYAPILRRIAAAGYFVVVVPMPLEMAFLAPDRALDAQARYPEIRRWALIGHSLGGAMAARFTHRHPDLVQGLVIWDSYPPESASLADYPRPVWHVHRATLQGDPPASFTAHRHLYPPESRWVPIRGGIHMYFGAFGPGGYVEEWAPRISRDEQHDRVVAATLEALAQM